jgi:hypothetical protein
MKSLTRGVRLVDGDGFNDDADATDERITLPKDVGAELALDDGPGKGSAWEFV